jgi:energy-coupling factor transporter ATP-binding protein EcfA2
MSEPEVTSVIGCTGSGKTTLVNELLKPTQRHIVMTTKPSGFKQGWRQVSTWAELSTVLMANYHRKRLRICLRLVVGPEDGKLPVSTMNGVANTLFRVQKKAHEKGILKQIGLTVDEAQVFCPHGANLDGVKWIVGQGREWGICPTFVTQRPTNIPPVIRDNSKNLYVLMLGGDTAVQAIKKLVGPSLKNPPQFSYSLYREGILCDQGGTKTPKKVLNLP